MDLLSDNVRSRRSPEVEVRIHFTLIDWSLTIAIIVMKDKYSTQKSTYSIIILIYICHCLDGHVS